MLDFVLHGLKDFRQTGAVLPSSPALARAMTRSLASEQGIKRVLEVGPGTGAFTKAILGKLRGGDSLDIVEMNPRFCEILQERIVAPFASKHSRVHVCIHNSTVQNSPIEGPYDFVVCGLPFNNFTPVLAGRILRKLVALLRPGGELAYFEYALIQELKAPIAGSQGRARIRRMRKLGAALQQRHSGTRELVLANVPPAVAVRIVKRQSRGS